MCGAARERIGEAGVTIAGRIGRREAPSEGERRFRSVRANIAAGMTGTLVGEMPVGW